jgi:hypothetical protein
MKRFYATCGAFIVAILLVGSVNGGPHHPGKRSGSRSSQRSAQRPRHRSVHPRGAHQPRQRQLPWQWLPEQPQVPGDYGPNPWGGDPTPGSGDPTPGSGNLRPGGGGVPPGGDDLTPGGDDLTPGDSQPGSGIGGGNAAQSAVNPKGGAQR